MDKRGKNVGTYKAYKGKKLVALDGDKGKQLEPAKIEMNQKIKMGTWHPLENTFALAKYNSLYIYTEKRA